MFLTLTSLIILIASLILPRRRAHIANRLFIYTNTFVSRPTKHENDTVNTLKYK